MKMTRILSVVVAMLLCISLVGCQGNEAQPTTAPTLEPTEAPVEEVVEAVVEETEAPPEETEAPVEEAEEPVEESEASVEETEAPVEESETPVEQSEVPVEESEETSPEAKAGVDETEESELAGEPEDAEEPELASEPEEAEEVADTEEAAAPEEAAIEQEEGTEEAELATEPEVADEEADNTEEAAAPEEAETVSAKATDDEASTESIKVGILAPLTGAVAQYGIAVRNGAALYIDQINANGGINGKQIEIVEYDEEGDPAKAVTGYNSLVDQGVTAVIGDVTTAPTLAVVPDANADNMPLITASATAAAVTYNEETELVYENVFRSCFIDPFQGEKMAAFASEKLEATKAAILYNTGSDYSVGLKDAFIAKAETIGLEVVAVEGFADGAVDFQSQLTNIASKEPDVLFVPDYYQVIALVAQQAKSAGVSANMLGGDGWDTVLSVVTDAELLEGAYYCSGYSSEDTTPEVQTFLADYKAKYEEEPNMFGAQAYDAAMILLTAIEKAEADGLTAGSDEYKQAVIDAMKATDMDCITGHVTYDEFNNPEKTAVIINITEGEAKFWGKY